LTEISDRRGVIFNVTDAVELGPTQVPLALKPLAPLLRRQKQWKCRVSLFMRMPTDLAHG
jgi:hypothetical protein